VLVAALVSLAVTRVTLENAGLGEHSEENFHEWLHENLHISAAQEEALLPHEQSFERLREEQRAEIARLGRQLAETIRTQGAESPEVQAAQRRLLEAQGELQRVTLSHFFAMKQHLDPEQGEKLLQWVHDSIVHGEDA